MIAGCLMFQLVQILMSMFTNYLVKGDKNVVLTAGSIAFMNLLLLIVS